MLFRSDDACGRNADVFAPWRLFTHTHSNSLLFFFFNRRSGSQTSTPQWWPLPVLLMIFSTSSLLSSSQTLHPVITAPATISQWASLSCGYLCQASCFSLHIAEPASSSVGICGHIWSCLVMLNAPYGICTALCDTILAILTGFLHHFANMASWCCGISSTR